MSKKLFTEIEILTLIKNHYVKHVSEKSITYTDEFKVHFINEYLSVKSPTRIFESAGFNKDMIGYKRIERAASRWKKDYAQNSWEGLKDYRKANLRTSSEKKC